MAHLSRLFDNHRGFFNALLVVALAVAVASLFDARPAGNVPRVLEGTIDLRQWNFARDGDVRLTGQWRYADRMWLNGSNPGASSSVLADVPGAWPEGEGTLGMARQQGFATYAVTVKLPPGPDRRLAIETGYVLSAYRVLANGAEIAASGTPSQSPDGERARAYNLIAPLPGRADTVELQFEISNHVAIHGGFFAAPVIGVESTLVARNRALITLSIFLIGAMFFAASYHVVAFMLARSRREALWFGLFAFLLGVRTLLIEPIAPFMLGTLSQDWVWRIDYAVSILLLPAAYHFFALSFPRHVARRYSLWLGAIGGLLACVSLIGGTAAGEVALKAFEFVALGAMMYLTYGIGRAAWAQEPGAVLAFAGWLLSAAATVHDIMLDNGWIAGPNLIPFGFLAFFLCLSGTMVARFRDAFMQATEYSEQMKLLNEGLEAAVTKRTRELQRAKMEAEFANVAKSRFLATMSHELRTPLNAILGFAQIIEAEALGSMANPKYKEYAGDIHRSGAHLLSLINDILDLSQIEAGKRELYDESVDIAELCRDSLSFAASRERRAQGSVTLDAPKDLPLVRADRRAVLQMVVNLVTNALKFTPDGKDIVLRASRREDGGVTISVIDHGIGMAAEDIPKALSMFSQVVDGHARVHEGTGLGLPIVKSLMEMHGGTLVLSSEKGKGTTVELAFPSSRTLDRGREAA